MTDGVSELRREEREQAAEAAAKAVDTKKRKRRAQYRYPDEVSKDEEDARDQFNHECRTAAFQTVKNDYIAAVELVFGEELFAVKIWATCCSHRSSTSSFAASTTTFVTSVASSASSARPRRWRRETCESSSFKKTRNMALVFKNKRTKHSVFFFRP